MALKGARNPKPFLLQAYRRDMSGGTFVMMKDVSAPITVKGRHWGCFRMGLRDGVRLRSRPRESSTSPSP